MLKTIVEALPQNALWLITWHSIIFPAFLWFLGKHAYIAWGSQATTSTGDKLFRLLSVKGQPSRQGRITGQIAIYESYALTPLAFVILLLPINDQSKFIILVTISISAYFLPGILGFFFKETV